MNPVEILNYDTKNMFIYVSKYDPFKKEHFPQNVNMTWQTIKFTNSMLTIQINFINPYNIS